MKKYILEYTTHDEILALLGREIPHEHLEHVSTIIVDLYEDEYNAIKESGYKIIENQPAKLLQFPANLPATRSYPTLPSYIDSYHKLTETHEAGFKGTGIKVAVLDTGCNISGVTICDTIQRIDIGYGVDDNANHGGKICCILGQVRSAFTGLTVNTGICYEADIYSYRVFDGGNIGVIAGINDCISRGVDIINISLDAGGGCDAAIAAAIAAGIIVVCASGNSDAASVAHPANILGVIAVNGVLYDNAIVPFGSYITDDTHTQVTITTYVNGAYEHILGGTSEGAGHITGLLALYKQKYPTLNTPKAVHLLKRKALPIDGFVYALPSYTLTKGVLENYQTGAGFISPIN